MEMDKKIARPLSLFGRSKVGQFWATRYSSTFKIIN